LLVVCGLLAFPDGESTQPQPEGFLGPLPTDSIDRLTLTTAEATLEAHQRGDSWLLTQPVPSAGDATVLEDLVASVSRWRVTATLSSASPADHGLVPPEYSLQLQRIDGTAPTLHIGAVAPGGAHTYARVDEGAVLILEGNVTDLLSRPLEYYRRRDLFVQSDAGVSRIDWQVGSNTWTAQRDGYGVWGLPEHDTPTRTGAIEGFFAALKATQLESFQDGLEPSAAGLEPPIGRVVLSGSDGEWELLIGPEKLGGTLVKTSDGLVGTIGDLDSLLPELKALQPDSISPPPSD